VIKLEPETVDRVIEAVRPVLEPLTGAEYLVNLREFVLGDFSDGVSVSGQGAMMGYRLGLCTGHEATRPEVRKAVGQVIALIDCRRADAGLAVDSTEYLKQIIPTAFERINADDD
jgi:hypothetical protein